MSLYKLPLGYLHFKKLCSNGSIKIGKPAVGTLSRVVDNRIRAEAKYGRTATREDLFLHFFVGALKEKTIRSQKEELELPLLLLFLWYCEPIDMQYKQD